MTAHRAIVRDMDIGHDPVVVPNAGDACILAGAGVEGTELADGVAIANHQLGRLARVLLVLRLRAQRCELENLVIFTDGGVPLDHAMRTNARTGPHLHMGADDAISPHSHRRVQPSTLMHDRGGMDVLAHQACFSGPT